MSVTRTFAKSNDVYNDISPPSTPLTFDNVDFNNVEHIELQPYKQYTAHHIPPPSNHQRERVILLNQCDICNTIGGCNFYHHTCHFCGGTVTKTTRRAKWVPTTKLVKTKHKYIPLLTTKSLQQIGGKWVDVID